MFSLLVCIVKYMSALCLYSVVYYQMISRHKEVSLNSKYAYNNKFNMFYTHVFNEI